MFSQFLKKWRQSTVDRTGLDVLLGQAPAPGQSLRQRLDWLRRLIHWIRLPGVGISITSFDSTEAGKLQTARLRYILQILDQNRDLKAKIAALLRSIIHETHALELFTHIGIPNEQGFIGECFERLHLRLLPQPPQDDDLISMFSETFRFKSDPEWIRRMDSSLFRGWMDLFHFDCAGDGWNSLIQDARDSSLLLSHSICAMGTSRLIRNRVKESDFRKLPFFELPRLVNELLNAKGEVDTQEAQKKVDQALSRCLISLNEVYAHFKAKGVSIALVYQVERLKTLVKRLRTLAKLISGYEEDPQAIQNFFALLVEENYRARRIRGLINDNIVLVCHKIVETNAETGEHYISRDYGEHFKIIKSAAGGGIVTGFTAFFKILLHHLTIAPFTWGLLASLNYAFSFVAIQLFGFTLATKQPAMTATALASKLDGKNRTVEPLIHEIVHLLRSQIATVVGNIMTVVPMVILIDWIFVLSRGEHFTDPSYAQKVVESFSILGPTPLYAAWTGVLLWASSVFSGLFANWFSFRGLPEAIQHQPRLVYVLGAHRAERLSHFLTRNMGGFASNISLAFLLGMTNPLGDFFGIPLDVRHVTLSTGAMSAACVSIGSAVFSQNYFWLGVAGLLSMAVLNLAVSFSLALIVAIWAKRTDAPSFTLVYRALLRRLLSAPWVLFLPSRAAE